MKPATDQQAEWFSHWFNALLDNVERVIKGKRDQIALALVCVCSEGHLLLDDVPGTGHPDVQEDLSLLGHVSRVRDRPDRPVNDSRTTSERNEKQPNGGRH